MPTYEFQCRNAGNDSRSAYSITEYERKAKKLSAQNAAAPGSDAKYLPLK